MHTPPPEIIRLQKIVGIELKPAKSVEILNTFFNSYLLNKKKEVIGLNLGWNNLNNLDFLSEFKHLTTLNLERNQFTDISPLSKLSNLTKLYLTHNQFTDISPLSKLSNLTKLYLSRNELTDISPLLNLPKLTVLSLGNTHLTNINLKQLSTLTNLTELNLSNNQLTNISPLSSLKNLTTLDLSCAEIANISPLLKLPKLTVLCLGNNELTYKSLKQLSTLTRLTYLELSNNQLTDISPLLNLTNLKTLYLWNNQLTDISPLSNLTKLTELYLEHNQITDISPLSNLTNLYKLVLYDNQITDISPLSNLTNLTELDLWNNPITNVPQEIINDGGNVLPKLRDYWADLEKGSIKNTELKLVFIGNGGVGKTQIAKRLVEKEKFVFNNEHDSTHGIALLKQNIAGVTCNLWDLGGQDLYYATHRLFMQTRAVFILVWDYHTERCSHHTHNQQQFDNYPIEYWLAYANYFAPKNPIIILQNKIDSIDPDTQKLLDSQIESYRQQYPQIHDICMQVSAQNGTDFNLLEEELKYIFNKNEEIKKQRVAKLPTTWVNIKNKIQALQEQSSEKFLPLSTFTNWLKAEKIQKSEATLLDYFHNAGVFYYKQGYFNNDIIIDQSWFIHKVYAVLDRTSFFYKRNKRKLDKEKGILRYADFEEIWTNDKEPNPPTETYLGFMLSTHLCIEITPEKTWHTKNEDRTFVVPQLLSPNISTEIESEKDRLNLIPQHTKQYGFLPTIIIQLFIINAIKISYENAKNMWQKGILMQLQEYYVLLEADYTKQTITVFTTQGMPHLNAIQEELEKIEKNDFISPRHYTETDKSTEHYHHFLQRKTGLDQFAHAPALVVSAPAPPPNKPIVLVCSAPIDLLHVPQEAQIIENHIRTRSDIIQIQTVRHATHQSFVHALSKHSGEVLMLHFGGHSSSKGIYLETETRGFGNPDSNPQTDSNPNLLSQHHLPILKNIDLIFFNSCLSAAHVPTLIINGTKALIATTIEIEDVKAKTFADTFYAAFFTNKNTLNAAFEFAAAAINDKNTNPITVDPAKKHLKTVSSWALYVHINHLKVLKYTLKDFCEAKSKK